MAIEEIHLGDIGTVFKLTYKDQSVTAVNLIGATTQEVVFKKPDSSVVTKTTVFDSDGSDGIVNYVTVSGDLDQAGTWQLQGHVVLPTGEWRSDIHKFKVYDNVT